MPKRNRKIDPAAAWEAQVQAQLDQLATYNAERARGIVHTPEWDERMAKAQARFDADVEREAQIQADAHTRYRRNLVNLGYDSGDGLPRG